MDWMYLAGINAVVSIITIIALKVVISSAVKRSEERWRSKTAITV